MMLSYLNRALESVFGKPSKSVPRQWRATLALEALESRLSPATGTPYYWWGQLSGHWDLAANWSTMQAFYTAATSYPGQNAGDIAVFDRAAPTKCDLTTNQSVSQISVTNNSLADELKIESGVTLTVLNGTASNASINKEILVLGTLSNTGGTLVVNNGNLAGSGTIAVAGGGMTFTNTVSVTVQTNISLDTTGTTLDTLQINNSAGIVLSPYTGSTEPQITIGANGTFDIHVDNTNGISADASITTYTPIDLRGTLTKTGTVASSPNNYFQIAAPIHLSGASAAVRVQGGDGLSFTKFQGSGPAGSDPPGVGNRGQAVFQESGTITLNNVSTLSALGMQMDGGSLTGYSTINTGASSSWTVALGSGTFYFNGGTINMGGTNNGGGGSFDYGDFNMTSTGSGFLWYHGTLNIGVYSGGGPANVRVSGLRVVGNINIESGGSGQTMAWAGGTPSGPGSTYYVMSVTGTGNTITVGLNPAVPPPDWSGGLVDGGNTIYQLWH